MELLYVDEFIITLNICLSLVRKLMMVRMAKCNHL